MDMTDDTELPALLPRVHDIAREAGAAILQIYAGDAFDIERKADHSPLTAADTVAHETILAGLRALPGDYPVLSEESAEVPYSERRHWHTYWLVDPLDGTREFIKRNGEFTVNIALVRDGVPVLGVVYAPVLDRLYYGSAADGAFRRDGGASAHPIHVRERAADPIRVAGSRSHANERMSAYLDCLGSHELRPMGSSLKSCLVAEGEADLYPRLGPTSEWDTAAAQAVVEAAGGWVVDAANRPLRYNQGESLLNPDFLVFGDSRRDWTACLPPAD